MDMGWFLMRRNFMRRGKKCMDIFQTKTTKYQFNDYNARHFSEKLRAVTIGKWIINYLSFCKEENQDKIPLFVIRGGFQKYDAFSALVKTFIDDYPVILIELPGEGESKQLQLELENEDYADLLKDFIDILQIEKIIPIATSHGAFIAKLFAFRYPDRTHRLILGGITPSIREDLRLLLERSIFYWARNRNTESSTLGLYSLVNFEKIDVTRINGVILRSIEHTLFNLDFAARLRVFDRTLKNIRTRSNGAPSCETLILVGEYDHVTRPEENYQFGLGCPQCFLAVFKNSDHLLHLEKQKIVFGLYRSFLQGDSIAETKSKVNDLKIYDEISNIKPEDFDPPKYFHCRLEATLIENNKRKHPCIVSKISQNDCFLEMKDIIDFRNQIRAAKHNIPFPSSSFGRKIKAYGIFLLIALERIFPSIHEYQIEIANFNLRFEVIPKKNHNNQVQCIFISSNQKKYEALRDLITSLTHQLDLP
jgi:pimeloyl-ACP methyl ester carboxylesterase